MISVLLLLLGAAAMFWPQLLEAVQKIRPKLPPITPRHLAGAALVAAAAFAFTSNDKPAPTPVPLPDSEGLSLAGLWSGPTASEDAAVVGALCLEIADELHFDGDQPQPYISTGLAVDELRKTARILRCRGISIGDRQPAARDAIAKYLDQTVGTDGGPLTPAQRAAWVTAYREVGRAASESAR